MSRRYRQSDKRLEHRGVIAGYTLKTSNEYEKGFIRAHVLITVLPKLVARVEAALRQIPALRTLHSVSGAFGMIAIVVASSISRA
jgi:DNA-binding Lrp family transcriptional regulator